MFNRDIDPRVYMVNRWLTMEQDRLQCAETWPDSPKKWATIAAIRSTMGALLAEVR